MCGAYDSGKIRVIRRAARVGVVALAPVKLLVHRGRVQSQQANMAAYARVGQLQVKAERGKRLAAGEMRDLILLSHYQRDSPDPTRGPRSLSIRVHAMSGLECAWYRNPSWRGRITAALAGRLNDKWAVCRLGAATRLSRLGATRQVREILPLLRDPDPMVRGAARKALGNLGYKLAPPAAATKAGPRGGA